MSAANETGDESIRDEAIVMSYTEREKYACDVCGNVPDEDGMIEHGRGCYVVNEDGGGITFVEFDKA